MNLGNLQFWLINAGHIYLDGGAMFGVVPKPLWEKKFPADSRNRIELSMNCLLVWAGGKTILIETGAGDKHDQKFREIYGLGEPRLIPELRKMAREDHEIDVVINTHLHFDHCGGNTRMENGRAIPSFPHARYVVQRGEFEYAQHATERDRASYNPDNYLPIKAACKLSLLEGDRTIAPGVELLRIAGHNSFMQCIKLHGGGKTAIFLADFVPTHAHLPLPWIAAYDLFPMTTLENKKKWIPEIAHHGWLAIFGHDPKVPAGLVKEKNGKYEVEPVKIS